MMKCIFFLILLCFIVSSICAADLFQPPSKAISAPPDKFGTYPAWWPIQKNINMPLYSPSTSSEGPSYQNAFPEMDPGGYMSLIYLPTSTFNNQAALSATKTYYNQFAWKQTDYLGFSFLDVGLSGFPIYNCTASGSLFTETYFGSGGFGGVQSCGSKSCCNEYYGFGTYYAPATVATQNVAITTVLQVGACDLNELGESLFCALLSGSGYCQERHTTRVKREYVMPCLDNMYFYYITNCPIYVIIGCYDNLSHYEPPLYVAKATVIDSIITKAFDQINMQDKICIPYSYFSIVTGTGLKIVLNIKLIFLLIFFFIVV